MGNVLFYLAASVQDTWKEEECKVYWNISLIIFIQKLPGNLWEVESRTVSDPPRWWLQPQTPEPMRRIGGGGGRRRIWETFCRARKKGKKEFPDALFRKFLFFCQFTTCRGGDHIWAVYVGGTYVAKLFYSLHNADVRGRIVPCFISRLRKGCKKICLYHLKYGRVGSGFWWGKTLRVYRLILHWWRKYKYLFPPPHNVNPPAYFVSPRTHCGKRYSCGLGNA